MVLVAHLVDAYWLIAPSFGEEITPLRPALLDLAAPRDRRDLAGAVPLVPQRPSP